VNSLFTVRDDYNPLPPPFTPWYSFPLRGAISLFFPWLCFDYLWCRWALGARNTRVLWLVILPSQFARVPTLPPFARSLTPPIFEFPFFGGCGIVFSFPHPPLHQQQLPLFGQRPLTPLPPRAAFESALSLTKLFRHVPPPPPRSVFSPPHFQDFPIPHFSFLPTEGELLFPHETLSQLPL